MMNRPDPRIVAIAHLAENLAAKMPQVRAHVRDQIDGIGSLKAAAYDGTPGGERTISVPTGKDANGNQTYDNVPCTAVEAHAIQRVHLADHLHDLELDIKGVAMLLSRILLDCDRIIGTRHIETPRCQGGQGRDGAIEWGRPDCTNIASRGGTPAVLCDNCSRREYRWRAARDLPPRSDGVFSAA